MDAFEGHPQDLAALALFALAWLAYEPVLRALARGRRLINADMMIVRRAWMHQMVGRHSLRLLDSQLVGHALNSASFFASSNLILIAAAAGVLFGGSDAYRKISVAPMVAHAPRELFGFKLALVAITLARGLLSFIWSIRQLNYCVAVIGAAPLNGKPELLNAYGDAAAQVLNPALWAFNAGVRGYYFALAAAAWLFGPAQFAAATVGAVLLLAWRQSTSPSARAVRRVRLLLDQHQVDEQAERDQADPDPAGPPDARVG